MAPLSGRGRRRRPEIMTMEDRNFYDYYALVVKYGVDYGTHQIPLDYVVERDGISFPVGQWLMSHCTMLLELAVERPAWYDHILALQEGEMLDFAYYCTADANEDITNNRNVISSIGSSSKSSQSSTSVTALHSEGTNSVAASTCQSSTRNTVDDLIGNGSNLSANRIACSDDVSVRDNNIPAMKTGAVRNVNTITSSSSSNSSSSIIAGSSHVTGVDAGKLEIASKAADTSTPNIAKSVMDNSSTANSTHPSSASTERSASARSTSASVKRTAGGVELVTKRRRCIQEHKLSEEERHNH